MSDAAIKRALEVAAQDLPPLGDMYEGTPEQAAAAAIAAFLRAPDMWEALRLDYEAVTEAVERAAGGVG